MPAGTPGIIVLCWIGHLSSWEVHRSHTSSWSGWRTYSHSGCCHLKRGHLQSVLSGPSRGSDRRRPRNLLGLLAKAPVGDRQGYRQKYEQLQPEAHASAWRMYLKEMDATYCLVAFHTRV